MKALVTGAGGFIGTVLTRELVTRGHSVRALCLPGEDAARLEALGAEIARGDITKPETLEGCAEGCDTVFHLAGRVLDWGPRRLFVEVMVDGTRNLLQATAPHARRFVYFSSIAAMGLCRHTEGFNEESERIKSGIPYCDTKMDAEDVVTDFCAGGRMEYTIVRPANVIGPRSVWVTDVLDAYRRAPMAVVDGGRAPGAFVYVDNLVHGAILAAEAPCAANRIYFFRDDYDITWGEYIRLLGSWVGKKPMFSMPFQPAWLLGYFLETVLTPFGVRPPVTRMAAGVMGRNNNVDASRAKAELGWKTLVSEKDALKEIENWVRGTYLVL